MCHDAPVPDTRFQRLAKLKTRKTARRELAHLAGGKRGVPRDFKRVGAHTGAGTPGEEGAVVREGRAVLRRHLFDANVHAFQRDVVEPRRSGIAESQEDDRVSGILRGLQGTALDAAPILGSAQPAGVLTGLQPRAFAVGPLDDEARPAGPFRPAHLDDVLDLHETRGRIVRAALDSDFARDVNRIDGRVGDG